jgi:NAD(P)-dependent dehydrogenase (short-subunit alcohol dehydrogenase family)
MIRHSLILSLLFLLLALLLSAPRMSSVKPLAPIDISSDLSNHLVLITGGTSGVGLEAAKNFASRGARVVLTGRAVLRAQAAAGALVARTKGLPHVGLQLDLTLPSSIRAFLESLRPLLAQTPKLKAAILNAGLVPPPDYTGPWSVGDFPGGTVDRMVAANHLGHCMLLGDPSLHAAIAGNAARVVFVSSISSHLATAEATLPEHLVNPIGGQEGAALGVPGLARVFAHYGTTKLLNLLTANKLSREFAAAGSGATAVAVTPGFAATAIGNKDRTFGLPSPLDYVPLAFSAAEGGAMLARAAAVDAALTKDRLLQPYWIWEGADAVFGTGPAKGVFHNIFQEIFLQKIGRGVYAHKQSVVATDEAVQDRVREWSLSMLGNQQPPGR